MTFKISDGMLLGSQVILDPDRVMTANDYSIKADYTTQRPSLMLDFTNNNKLDTRITFTRSTVGTYFSNEKHTYAQNLAPYSENMDTSGSIAWTKGNATITLTTAVVPPTGSGVTNCLIFAETATSTVHYTYANYTGDNIVSDAQLVTTNSIYLKSGTQQYVQIVVGASSSGDYAGIVINLANGTVTQKVLKTSTVLNNFTYSVTDAGGGWYRCSVTAVGRRYFLIGPVGNTATHVESTNNYGFPAAYLGVTTNTFYMCGPQVEFGTAPSAYNPTSLTINNVKVTGRTMKTAAANQPRFEYDPITGESKGLLLEEARTNQLTYSSQFDNAAWVKTNATVTPNIVIAPDGTLTADKLTEDTASAYHYLQTPSSNLVSGTAYTYSVYAKAAGRSTFYMDDVGSPFPNPMIASFDLSTGTINTSTGCTAFIQYVGGGWYRCGLTATAQTTGAARMQLVLQYNTYTGDGASGMYFWGAQLEAGAYATSYIPTVASSVTRQADTCTINISDIINTSAGTVYANFDTFATGNFAVFHMGINNAGTPHINFSTNYDGLYGATYGNVPSIIKLSKTFPATAKAAYAYNDTNNAFSLDGAININSNPVVITNNTTASIGGIGASNKINGHIKSVRYYNTRLSDAQLKVLTA